MIYEEATARDMRQALAAGETSAAGLLKEARRVIREKDGDSNAFVEVFDSAESDAVTADAMIAEGTRVSSDGYPDCH